MARQSLRTSDGQGFLRAFTDEWKDTEKQYEVLITMSVEPSKRKGVLEHRLVAWGEGERRGSISKAAYTFEYPTSMVATYEAFLFQGMTRLARILEGQKLYPGGKG